jgi:hypothetical protein
MYPPSVRIPMMTFWMEVQCLLIPSVNRCKQVVALPIWYTTSVFVTCSKMEHAAWRDCKLDSSWMTLWLGNSISTIVIMFADMHDGVMWCAIIPNIIQRTRYSPLFLVFFTDKNQFYKGTEELMKQCSVQHSMN